MEKLGYWVVVSGVDDAVLVVIRATFGGTQYKMNIETLKETLNGYAVYKE